MKRDVALSICGISKHKYYNYHNKTGVRGRKPTTTTYQINKHGVLEEVDNGKVLEDILKIKSNPETDYGYDKMTFALMLLGFIINHKKVYRLMKEYQLLHDSYHREGRNYVKFMRVTPKAPLEVLEMDIKYQWVAQHSRYAFILTIIDCFTRYALHWSVAYSIKKEQVKDAWEEVIANYLQTENMLGKGITVEIRNDNDSRFAAKEVQAFFKENYLNQVFTHPYTPQENGHIESFHAILSRSLERKEFFTINQLEKHLKYFYRIYNQVRLHGSLDHLSPKTFWKLWKQDLIETKELKNKKLKHSLLIPHYQLSGNGSLREISSLLEEQLKEAVGANALQQPSVQRSPSVISS
jgi:transposase InsO family protein